MYRAAKNGPSGLASLGAASIILVFVGASGHARAQEPQSNQRPPISADGDPNSTSREEFCRREMDARFPSPEIEGKTTGNPSGITFVTPSALRRWLRMQRDRESFWSECVKGG